MTDTYYDTYYVVETEYVGPNQSNLDTDLKNIIYGHFYDIQTEPGRKNMSHEPAIEGWLGTSNDWAKYARGVFDTLEAAQAFVLAKLGDDYRLASDCDSCPEPEDSEVVERYYVGDEKSANLWDAGDWLDASKYETDEGISLQQCAADGSDALITAATTDDELAELAGTIEAQADGESVTLHGGALATLEEYRERAIEIRNEQADDLFITFTSFDNLGQQVGEGILPSVFFEEFSEELFANGGHVEIWDDDTRLFDEPATSAALLSEQLQKAVAAQSSTD